MPTNEPLKPCSCQNSRVEVRSYWWEVVMYYVKCNTCERAGPAASTVEEARRLWNQREVEAK